MGDRELLRFITIESAKIENNYAKGTYSLDKAIGGLATLSALGAHMGAVHVIQEIGALIWKLRDATAAEGKAVH